MFVSLEGIDGSGKTTQAKLLAKELGEGTVLVREPGGTELGERLRDLILKSSDLLSPMVELQLFCVARSQLVDQVIRPALDEGRTVVSDRFSDSSVAYQGGGRGLDRSKMEALENWVHPHLQPDLTLLFDVPLDVARARLDATRTLDKFEQEQADFFSACRNEYLRRAAQFPQRIVVIDSTQAIAAIRDQVSTIIEKLL